MEFKQPQNLETAFQYIRLFCIIYTIVITLLAGLVIFKSYQGAEKANSRLYILANGKVMEAFASSRNENVQVEAKDHIQVFLHDFFTLSPDDKAIEATINKALYLADGSAKRQYDDMKESGYYNSVISGNVSQSITIDSVALNTEKHPYLFRCFATVEITRSSSVVTRSLISEGQMRNVARSDHNPHGFLIERWNILENKDLSIKKR